jgi:hypothetical protein
MYQEGTGTRRQIKATGISKMRTGMKWTTFESRKPTGEKLKTIGAIINASGRYAS